MTLTYQLNIRDGKEKLIADDFCKYLIDRIQFKIKCLISFTNAEKIKNFEKVLLNTETINWTVKPTSISIYNVLNILLNHITFDKSKDSKYYIHFKNVNFPNTYNSVSSIARLLDKGNEEYIGLYVFGNVFSEFARNINDEWELYVYKRLNRISVSKVVVLK